MPVPVDGLIEVTLTGNYLGKNWAAVYHYWNSANAQVSGKAALATEFNAKVSNRLSTLVHDQVVFENIKIRDVLGITPDYDQPPSNPQGDRAGTGLPRFNAIPYRYSVATKETHVGYKRYPGVIEADQTNGVMTPAFLLDCQAEEINFLQPLVNGGDSYQPVVYGRATPSNPTRSIVNIVNGITTIAILSSQGSRR